MSRATGSSFSLIVPISHRDLGLDRIILDTHAGLGHVEQSGADQCLDVGVNVAVVALERLRKCPNAGRRMTVNVAQDSAAYG
jgi:hypothetical protein